METAAILAIIDGALTILEKIAPQLQQELASGTISPEVQAQLFNRINVLRPGNAGGKAPGFQGPEWSQSKNVPPTISGASSLPTGQATWANPVWPSMSQQ